MDPKQEMVNQELAKAKNTPRLQKNTNYCCLVTNVTNNKKNFLSSRHNGGNVYVNRIWLKDDNGTKYEAEYLSEEADQQIFKKGEMAQFYVVTNGVYIDEIEPLPEWVKGMVSPCNSKLEKFKESLRENHPGLINMHVAPEDDMRDKYEQHKMLALQYAKDIVCAQISAGAKLNSDEVKSEVSVLQKKFYEIIVNI